MIMKRIVIFFISVFVMMHLSVISQAAERTTFGSYPQTEIKGSSLTNEIKDASYDVSTGKATIGDTTYYKLTWQYDEKGKKVALSSPKYYKCEPISWIIMSTSNGETRMICEKAMDACFYSESDEAGYDKSMLKSKIENNFFQEAFSDSQKNSMVMDTKAFAPAFADMISVSYGFTSNASRCLGATDFAKTLSGVSQNNGYWIQGGFIGKDGTATSSASQKGIYSVVRYVVPCIRIRGSVQSTMQPAATPYVQSSDSPEKNNVSSLAKPKGVKISNVKPHSQSLSWKKVKNATFYSVYRGSKKDGQYVKVAQTKKTKAIVNKLTIGKKYYYRIFAENGEIQSGFSKTIFKRAGVPDAPSLTVEKTKKGIVCRWKHVNAAQGIIIYDRINGSSFTPLYNGSLNSKTKKGCVLHPSYVSGNLYIKVRTYNKNVKKKYYSPFSNVVKISL